MQLTQLFRVIGIANQITYDAGLKSTEVEKKRLLSIKLLVSEYQENDVQVYHERAKLQDYPDRLFDYEAVAFGTNILKPGARINEIEIGLEIPVGETVKAAIKCGANATNLYGCYVFELY